VSAEPAETVESGEVTAPQRPWRVAVAGPAGTTVEYYDFAVFSAAAALVFPTVFFPGSSPAAGALSAFATFAVGFTARPVGGIVFGHFGDRAGRKTVLVFTLVLMGVATVGIGLLPSYETLGILAPVLLVALRLMQGFAFGGEWGGAVLMAFEHAPKRRRGLFGSVPQIGPVAGTLLGSLAFLLVGLLPRPELLAWGWRVPFLAGGVLIVLGLVIRLGLTESPEFSAARRSGATPRIPLVEVLRTHPRHVLLVMGASVGIGVVSFTFATFLLGHATSTLGVASTTVLSAVAVANVAQLVLIPAAGALSDRYGRRRVFLLGAAIAGLGSFLAPVLLAEASFGSVLLYLVPYGVGIAALAGTFPSLVAESFPTAVRYTGMSVGFQLAQAIAGFAPFLLALLLGAAGTIYVAPAAVLAFLAVAAACAWWLDSANRRAGAVS
jgi:MFS transporter, MHS family, shikimate and dehydroshikimate transport protein